MTRPTCSDPDPQSVHLESLFNLKPSEIYWVNVRANETESAPRLPRRLAEGSYLKCGRLWFGRSKWGADAHTG